MRVIDNRPGESSYARRARRIKVPDHRATLDGREFKIGEKYYVEILALVVVTRVETAIRPSGINVEPDETSHSDGQDETCASISFQNSCPAQLTQQEPIAALELFNVTPSTRLLLHPHRVHFP